MTARTPTIVETTDRTPAEWDRLAVHSPGGHAFQSHAWGELKRPLGWSVRRFVIEDAGTPLAVIALQVRPLLGRSGVRLGRGGPAYGYAPRGPILLRPEADADAGASVVAGLRDVARAVDATILTLDPAWPADGPLSAELRSQGFAPAAREVQVSRTAMVVPVLGDESEQHRLVRKSTAHLINRARREGAAAEPIDLGSASPAEIDEALATMHDLLAATARREGIVLRDREYQVSQWRALGAAGIASLWFGRVGDRRWAGSVLLRCGGTLVQFQAGSADDADLRRVPANHLLQWEILRWAAGAGYAGYDMGGVDTVRAPGVPRDESHPLWNLYLFKHGFGAQAVEYVGAHEYAANPLARVAWRVARAVRR